MVRNQGAYSVDIDSELDGSTAAESVMEMTSGYLSDKVKYMIKTQIQGSSSSKVVLNLWLAWPFTVKFKFCGSPWLCALLYYCWYDFSLLKVGQEEENVWKPVI